MTNKSLTLDEAMSRLKSLIEKEHYTGGVLVDIHTTYAQHDGPTSFEDGEASASAGFLLGDRIREIDTESLVGELERRSVKREAEEVCEWEYDDIDDKWHTPCGLSWIFTVDSTRPDRHDCYFCPRCGKKIKVKGG